MGAPLTGGWDDVVRKPRIGEYYYGVIQFKSTNKATGELHDVKTKKCLCEIVGLSADNHALVEVYNPLSCRKQWLDVDIDCLLDRWHPNWFWRLMGYKDGIQ